MRKRGRKESSGLKIAGVFLLAGSTTVGLAGAAAAGPSTGGAGQVNFTDLSYILNMRSAAVEPFANIPREIVTDYGYTSAELFKDRSAEEGTCETYGAGYWLGMELEEAVLGPGFAPPTKDDQNTQAGGYHNPVFARDYYPVQPFRVAHPSVTPTPVGTEWTAKCNKDAEGHSVARNVAIDIPGIGSIGAVSSVLDALVDRTTGVYTATSRSYLANLTTSAGSVDAIQSVMQVRWAPGEKEPTISYRTSIIGAGDGKSANAVGGGKTNVSFFGTDVPADTLTTQFNQQVANNSNALAAIAKLGFVIAAPEHTVSVDGNRPGLAAPVVMMQATLPARKDNLGDSQGVRLATTRFEGVY